MHMHRRLPRALVVSGAMKFSLYLPEAWFQEDKVSRLVQELKNYLLLFLLEHFVKNIHDYCLGR